MKSTSQYGRFLLCRRPAPEKGLKTVGTPHRTLTLAQEARTLYGASSRHPTAIYWVIAGSVPEFVEGDNLDPKVPKE